MADFQIDPEMQMRPSEEAPEAFRHLESIVAEMGTNWVRAALDEMEEAALVKHFGSLRIAGRALRINYAYLARLRSGAKGWKP